MRNYNKGLTSIIMLTIIMLCNYAYSMGQKIEYGQISSKDTETTHFGVKAKSNPMIIGPELYNQFDNITNVGVESIEYLDANLESFTGEVVDDFNVPTGESWTIDYVKTSVISQDPLEVYDNFNVSVYADNSGVPGSLLSKVEGQSIYNQTQDYGSSVLYDMIINLTSSISVSSGKYWVGVSAVTSSPEMYLDGPYYILFTAVQTSTNVIGEQAHVKNQFYQLSNWAPLSKYWEAKESNNETNNLNFALYGEAKAYDIALTDVVSPVTDAELGETVIAFEIQNHGTTDIEASTYSIVYKLDNGTEHTEIINMTISAGEEIIYDSHELNDFSEVKNYVIDARIEYSLDENSNNNSLSKEIINYGKLYPAISDQKTIYTVDDCLGTLTDNGGLTETCAISVDTVVLLPNGPDKRIRLEFYDMNDWGNRKYKVYNGSSTNAELIAEVWRADIAGMIFEGNNADGALTFATPAKPSAEKKFRAKITCVDNKSNDFEVNKVSFSKYTSWEKETIDIIAHVINKSTSENAVNVSFTANDVLLGMVSATFDEFGQTKLVKFPWAPETNGIYNVKAAVPADEGLLSEENEYNISKEIFELGAIVEGFEHLQYPPELWTSRVHGGGFVYEIGANNRMFMEGEYCVSFKGDTLITPLLDIENTDTLKFFNNNDILGGNTKLLYSESINGPWIVYKESISGYWDEVEISLKNIPEGKYYLAFVTSGSVVMLDYIRGVKAAIETHDLIALKLDGRSDPQKGKEEQYAFKIRNLGSEVLNGEDYAASLWRVSNGDTLRVDSIAGAAINQSDYYTFTFKPNFSVSGAATLYATIDFPEDKKQYDNKSNEMNIQIIEDDLSYVLYGDAESTIEDRYTLRPNAGGVYSENLYNKADLNFKGEIRGISLEYLNKGTEGVPVDIYLGGVDDENVYGDFLSTKNMDLVYSGTLCAEVSENEFVTLYIPFEKPYLYSGEKNLVMAYHVKQSIPGVYLRLKSTNTTSVMHHSYSFQSYEEDTDISDTDVLKTLKYSHIFTENVPNVMFYTDTTNILASLSGTVVDTASAAMTDVEISFNKFSNTVKTDANGKYEFPTMPYGEVDVKAVMYGYFDTIQTATLTEGNHTIVDFVMNPLPSVGIKGKVVANDSLQPIENVEIFVSGYGQEASVFTDENGDFLIPSILANQYYEVKYVHQKYVTLIDSVFASLEGTNVGQVVLDEIEQGPFNVIAEIGADNIVTVSWNDPYTGVEGQFDPTNSTSVGTQWTASLNEKVELGNLFKVDKPATVSSIEVTSIDWYDPRGPIWSDEAEVALRIYNKDREQILPDIPFILPDTTTGYYFNTTVDVPDFTVNDDFYVTVYWDGIDYYTPKIAEHYGVEDVAYHIKDGKWDKLIDIVGESYAGAFGIKANIVADSRKATKGLINYNVWRTDLENVNTPDNWIKLNDQEITANGAGASIIDADYSSLSKGYYCYVVESYYTLDTAPVVYSNLIAKDLYSHATLNVTANNDQNIDNAVLHFKHSDGHDIHDYTGALDNGKIIFDEVIRGNYTLTIDAGPTYKSFKQNMILVNEDTVELDVVLEEEIFDPANLWVDADTSNNMATLNWTTGTSILLQNDNDEFTSGTMPMLGYNVGLGNLFEIVGTGTITSVEVLPIINENNEGGEVRLVIYSSDESVLYESDPFELADSLWMNIPIPNVNYDGSFYALIEWSATETRYSNAILADNSDGCYGGTLRTDAEGFATATLDGELVAFGVRANVSIGGKNQQLSNYNETSLPSVDISDYNINVIPSTAKYSEAKGATNFQIYIDNVLVAENVTDKKFVFNESEHLTKEGLATYKAGVKAIYASGESMLVSIDFEYERTDNGTSINSIINNVSLFPNPANSEITITNCENSEVEIYNAIGVLVAKYNINTDKQVIRVSKLAEGSYIVVINNKQGKSYKNLIINR